MKKISIFLTILLLSTQSEAESTLFGKIIDTNISKIGEKVTKTVVNKFNVVIGNHSQNQTEKEDFKALYKKEIKDIWEDVIKKLDEAVKLEKEKEKLPEHAIFHEDKRDVQKDINEIFDDLLELILDGDLFKYRKDLQTLEKRIDELQKKILIYREKRVIAPQTSIMATTKSGYDKKIKEAQAEIEAAKKEIELIKKKLSQNLKFVGINLTPAQIDVLLSRVDGDDIIQMTIIMEVLKEITAQLSEIMQESSKNLKYAKKYYGMHMVLVEMVAWIQQKLINKYNNEYIPNIDKIIDQSKNMIEKTKEALSKEKDPKRLKIYKQNLLTQEYTYKIAQKYKKDLLEKLQQLKKSYAITLKDLKLAKNTFKTVSLSDELFKVIEDSQKTLDAVIKLQIPTIVPFDSQIIKEKYQELTKKIKSSK